MRCSEADPTGRSIRRVSEPRSDLTPIGPGRWQGPDGRLFLQAYDADGRALRDAAGNPIVEPSSTGLGLEPIGRVSAPPPPPPEEQRPRRRFWRRRPR